MFKGQYLEKSYETAAWGACGRRFKSFRPDHYLKKLRAFALGFFSFREVDERFEGSTCPQS
ncbi:MAG: hypothetical protein A2351_07510 [Omnitrophica bacterium RIFOXYB12_FULL_50_7]|nr:MAG: hypothetical protein A2351_07510 [Omnitrophica bacterium RIFOXYB12_FULL_50_7]